MCVLLSTAEEVDEVDFLVSGWGEQEMDLSEDLLKQWGDMLEKWDGRERWDPNGDKPRNKQLVKLVRKVCYLGHHETLLNYSSIIYCTMVFVIISCSGYS